MLNKACGFSFRFEALCEQAEDIDVEDDEEVNDMLQKFEPFSKDDLETLTHVKVMFSSFDDPIIPAGKLLTFYWIKKNF